MSCSKNLIISTSICAMCMQDSDGDSDSGGDGGDGVECCGRPDWEPFIKMWLVVVVVVVAAVSVTTPPPPGPVSGHHQFQNVSQTLPQTCGSVKF